jgi:predicted methyltransferase
LIVGAAAAIGLAGCGEGTGGQATQGPAPVSGSLDWALAGSWRIDPGRDRFRHPRETLAFFEVQPTQTIVEIWPGRGWWTSILGPWATAHRGRVVAAHFDPEGANEAQLRTLEEFRARFLANPALFGAVSQAAFGRRTGPIADRASADRVMVMRNLHNFMADGWVEKAFTDFHAVLKPGGLLGIEQHRAPDGGVQDLLARTGYVQEAYVRMLAEGVGFEFIARSDLNANPRDDRDHPFGVWTLPPVSRTSPLGQPPDERFDRRPFDEIGESDRMTLLFRKPL